ncbi:MAG: hypothetical protein Q7N50_16120 [Armatimonadota bacterium]|nr:hypothetical protein [Armatimonadota bacterium]
MAFTATDIAAWIGATAWIPPVVYWIYGWLVKPVVQIMPEGQVELGFTTFGPIFNIRLALSASNKDAIIERMWAELQHESGELRKLTWTGMRETFSEITDAAGNRQLVERDQPAIVLKVSTLLLTEKLVRFQDLAFQERQRPLRDAFVMHGVFLSKQADAHEALLASRQFFDVLEFYKAGFWWKPGRYSVRFCIEGRDQARVRAQSWEFEMMPYDGDALQQNVDLVKIDFENTLKSHLPDFKPEPVPWAWRYVPLVKP